MSGKRVFISDVHLGAGRFSEESRDPGRYKHDWDWLTPDETANFENFLRHLHSGYDHDLREVILLGDIFDTWIFPHDIVPPTMEELITAEKNAGVVKALNELAKKVKVFYVPGNHDMEATEGLIKDLFPDIIYCPMSGSQRDC